MVLFLVPVGASALGFGSLHLLLRHGPPYRRLKRAYQQNQDNIADEDIGNVKKRKQRSDPGTLASQASARILNDIHNIVQVPLAIAVMLQKHISENQIDGSSGLARAMTLVSAGYFWTDTAIVSTAYHEHGPEPLIHALICITFYTYAAVKDSLHYYAARLLLFEVSTPFVHLRWLLHSLHMDNTKIYKVNGVAMMAAFFMCRVAFGSRLIFDFWKMGLNYLRGKTVPKKKIGKGVMVFMMGMGVGIQVLNAWWMLKMVRGAIKVFSPKKPALTNGHENKLNNEPATN